MDRKIHRIETRLRDLGLELPSPATPVASYAPVILHGGLAHVSGQLPRSAEGLVTGVVGRELSTREAKAAARLCAISLLAVMKPALGGDLERISACLQLSGFVNATPDFTDHSEVMNGASDLMLAVLEEAGRHARAAVGVASLPFGVAVEVSAIFAVEP